MKKTAVLLLLLAAATPAFSQYFETPQSEVSVRDLLENSKKAPKSDTYYLMALSAARKNDLENANKAIATGLSINPRNTSILNLKAALLARQGRLVQARQIFLNVLQMNPNDEYANKCLNSIEVAMQPKRNQITTMVNTKISSEKAGSDAPIAPVEQKPVSTEKVLTASYFEELKHKQDCAHGMSLAQIAQDKLIARNPKDKVTFSLTDLVKEGLLTAAPVCPKGGIYSWKNNEVCCSKHGGFSALDAEVTSVFKEYNTGLRAKLSRNYLDALKAFEQVVILYPLWAEAHYQLGDTLSRLGETDPALNSLRTCLKHDPGNLDAQLLMANLYFKKGQKQAALTILDRISEKYSGSVYGLSARSVAKSIRSGRNYYQIFPPN